VLCSSSYGVDLNFIESLIHSSFGFHLSVHTSQLKVVVVPVSWESWRRPTLMFHVLDLPSILWNIDMPDTIILHARSNADSTEHGKKHSQLCPCLG
jgi:hypothetical protein